MCKHRVGLELGCRLRRSFQCLGELGQCVFDVFFLSCLSISAVVEIFSRKRRMSGTFLLGKACWVAAGHAIVVYSMTGVTANGFEALCWFQPIVELCVWALGNLNW